MIGNKKKNILYVSSFQLPDKNAAAQRVIGIAKLLRDIGYNVIFLDTDTTQCSRLEHREPCFGFERWSIAKSNKYLISVKEHIEVAETINELDAIIAYNHPAVALFRLHRYCKKRQIKLISDATEWYAAEGPNLIYRLIKKIDTELRMRYIHPRLTGIITISKFLTEFYQSKVSTLYLPPLVDIKDTKWKYDNGNNKDDKIIRIIYAGSPGRNKDKLNYILRALSQCKTNFIFHIIGITKDEFIESYPEEKGVVIILDEKVKFWGRKSHVDVIEKLKISDFVLFFRELNRVTIAGFPTKFVEAFSAGIPVLTNRNSDLAYYLKDGVNGFWIDNIDTDLNRVLSLPMQNLKAICNGVDRYIFDYRNYTETLKLWYNALK